MQQAVRLRQQAARLKPCGLDIILLKCLKHRLNQLDQLF
jgi:hypothetical protein